MRSKDFQNQSLIVSDIRMIYWRAVPSTQRINCFFFLQITFNSQLIELGISTRDIVGASANDDVVYSAMETAIYQLFINYVAIMKPYVPRILNHRCHISNKCFNLLKTFND